MYDTPWDGDEETQWLDAALDRIDAQLVDMDARLTRLEASLDGLVATLDATILRTKRLVIWANVLFSLELAVGFGLVVWLR